MYGVVENKDLFELVLMRPLYRTDAPDSLKILSGYATHAMAARHLIEVTARKKSLAVDLVYGMAGVDGVSKINHLGFVSLETRGEFAYSGNFVCSYVKRPSSVHSKIYIWCRGGIPVQAFIGSANYSEAGFNLSSRTEALAECDPISALDAFTRVKAKAVACGKANRDRDFSPRHHEQVSSVRSSHVVQIEDDKTSPFYNHEKVVLSLLTSEGGTGNGSRLNWGVRPDGTPRMSTNGNGSVSRRDPNQSYIGLPADLQRSGFFPDIKRRFTVLTDDNQILTCVRAQANGKGIETPQDNSEIGRYFRNRLGLASGAYISVDDLKRYGRTNVVFYKLDDENYAMDFARPK